MEQHLNLFYPQWQGSGESKDILRGAKTIINSKLVNFPFKSVAVSEEDNINQSNDILGYDLIISQLKNAQQIIDESNPETIFTIGGGCDSEIPSINYLNQFYNNNITVLWIDAHGDLNTPKSSDSKHFHGMPLRILIENVDNELDEVFKYKLKPSQAILIGQRDLDKPEIDFIRKNEISIYDDINKIENDRKNIIEQLKEISSDNLYLHIDLDVLDNIDFPEVLVPVEGGIKSNQLIGLIEDLRKEFTIVGMGLVEYTGSDISNNSIIQYLLSIGSHLSE